MSDPNEEILSAGRYLEIVDAGPPTPRQCAEFFARLVAFHGTKSALSILRSAIHTIQTTVRDEGHKGPWEAMTDVTARGKDKRP